MSNNASSPRPRRFPSSRVPSDIRLRLARLGMRPRKGLGQHFLVDRNVRGSILRAARPGDEDVVVEVGPGTGVLTERLVGRVRLVVAVERDERLAAALERDLGSKGGLRVVCADALQVEPAALLEQSGLPRGTPYKLLGNLPYFAATAIIRHFLCAGPPPSLMVVTVQREVAQSLASSPPHLTHLGASTQLRAKVELLVTFGPRAFYPPPKVHSAVVRLTPLPQPAVAVDDLEAFESLLRAGHSAPRKQLVNALAQALGCPASEVREVVARARLEPRSRAEALGLDDWARLYRAWREHRPQNPAADVPQE